MRSGKGLLLSSLSVLLLLNSQVLAASADDERAVCLVEDELVEDELVEDETAASTEPAPAQPSPTPTEITPDATSPPIAPPPAPGPVESSGFAPAPFSGPSFTLPPALPATTDRQPSAGTPLEPPNANPGESNPVQPPDTPGTSPATHQSPAPSTSQTTSPPASTPSIPLPSPTPPPSTAPTPSTPQIKVNQVEVTGSTVFDNAAIDPIVQPLRNRSFSLPALQTAANQAADRITALYVQEGYITSFAAVDETSLATGNVRIQVVEGRIAEIRISGLRRLNPSYVCSRLRLATEPPLNANRLEEKLRLLKIDPLFENVEAILQRPEPSADAAQQDSRLGQSILRITVVEADPVSFEVSFDNHLPSTIAPQQLSAGIRHRDLTGFGDELAFSYSLGVNVTDFPRAALHVYDLTYRLPLNPREGALQLRAVYSDSAITDAEFDQFGFRGTAEFYEAVYRQPLIRNLREEFALSVGFTLQNSQTFIFDNEPNPFEIGPDEDGFSRTRVIRFGQDYVRRDAQGAWGAQSQFSFGLDIFDATENTGSIPDGQFFSWLAQVTRFQELGNDFRLIVRSGLQLTPDPLLSSQQFFIGGASTLRGYPPNSRRGDNGLFLAVEGRVPLFRNSRNTPIFQLVPFAELGYVWNDPANPNPLPEPNFLSDVGVGFLFQPNENLVLELDLALPFNDLDDRRDNLQDHGIYFNADYSF